MKATVTLLARVSGKYSKVEFYKKQPIAVPGAIYYARYSDKNAVTESNPTGRVMQPLGKDFKVAIEKFLNIEIARLHNERGLPVPENLTAAQPESSELTIAARIQKYLHQIDRQVSNGSKSRKTYDLYRYGLEYFEKFCAPRKITMLTQLTRDHMLDFQTFLRKDNKLDGRTLHTCFNTIMIFFKWADHFKVPDLQIGDRPPLVNRKVEEYSDEELDLFLQHAKPEERLVIECFLFSGLRSGELQHLTYGDIEFANNILHVEPKPAWNWKPKKNKSREVAIPDFLTAQLHERMKKWNRRGTDLVFFNRNRQPDANLLRHVKNVAKRARVTGRVDDHKFRSTAITRWLQQGYTVQDVMGFVGHKHANTIMLYAARVNLRKPETRTKINATWAQFAPQPRIVRVAREA